MRSESVCSSIADKSGHSATPANTDSHAETVRIAGKRLRGGSYAVDRQRPRVAATIIAIGRPSVNSADRIRAPELPRRMRASSGPIDSDQMPVVVAKCCGLDRGLPNSSRLGDRLLRARMNENSEIALTQSRVVSIWRPDCSEQVAPRSLKPLWRQRRAMTPGLHPNWRNPDGVQCAWRHGPSALELKMRVGAAKVACSGDGCGMPQRVLSALFPLHCQS